MFNSNNTGWQRMHVNVQIVLVRCADHAEQTEETHKEKTELLVGLVC
jgi:hypothetical protein